MSVSVRILGMLFLCLVGASSAEASREHTRQTAHDGWWAGAMQESAETPRGGRRASRSDTGGESLSGSSHGGLGPRPSQWCGWWMRSQRGGGPEYNLAWNWTRYGSPGSPQVGAVVVWPHHVGEIVGQTASGQWIVRSGNDGGRVRERARSIAGAIIRV